MRCNELEGVDLLPGQDPVCDVREDRFKDVGSHAQEPYLPLLLGWTPAAPLPLL